MRSYNLWLDLYIYIYLNIFKPHSLLYSLKKSKSPSIIAWITAWWFWPVRRGIRWDQSANFSRFNCFNPPCFEFKRLVFHQLSYWKFRLSENRATPFQWFVETLMFLPCFSVRCWIPQVLNQVFQPVKAPRAVPPPLQHLPRCWRSNARGRRWPFWSWRSNDIPRGTTKGHQGVVMAFLGSRWILGGWDLIVDPLGLP